MNTPSISFSLSLIAAVTIAVCVPKPAHAGLLWYMVGNSNGQASGRAECERKHSKDDVELHRVLECYRSKLSDPEWQSHPKDIVTTCEKPEGQKQ